MQQKTSTNSDAKPAQSREQRLKAALKANMAKRKAQAKERASAKRDDKEQG